MAVEILNESGIEVPEDALLRMARHVYARLHVHERAETAVTVVDAARMAELHEEWMDPVSYTHLTLPTIYSV